MITGFIALLGCQLLGEFAVRALGVPIPGPVVGMVLLLVVLLIRKPERTAGVVRAADGLLRHLQLLFIPAGAGVVAYLSVLGASWLPVLGGLVISWLAVLVVTAGTGAAALRVESRSADSPGPAVAEGAGWPVVNLQFAQAWAAVTASPLFGVTLTLVAYQAARSAVATHPRELAGQPGVGGGRHRRRDAVDLQRFL